MNAESSRMIPRKPKENLELLIVEIDFLLKNSK